MVISSSGNVETTPDFESAFTVALLLRGTIDIATLQTLARRTDITELTAGYGLVVADECHHVPAAAFENAVRQIPARRWLGLTATPTGATSSTT